MQKSSAKSLPSLSVRIDLDSRGRIGPGKIQLLENIQACGSISAAGRAMDMSYKRAWDLVDEINRICRRAAVERQTGGKNGGGASLTPFGTSLVARYRKIERAAASAVRKDLQALRVRHRGGPEEELTCRLHHLAPLRGWRQRNDGERRRRPLISASSEGKSADDRYASQAVLIQTALTLRYSSRCCLPDSRP